MNLSASSSLVNRPTVSVTPNSLGTLAQVALPGATRAPRPEQSDATITTAAQSLEP